jgi:hypothetical protein
MFMPAEDLTYIPPVRVLSPHIFSRFKAAVVVQMWQETHTKWLAQQAELGYTSASTASGPWANFYCGDGTAIMKTLTVTVLTGTAVDGKVVAWD